MIWSLVLRLMSAIAEARREYRDFKRELGTYSNRELEELLREDRRKQHAS